MSVCLAFRSFAAALVSLSVTRLRLPATSVNLALPTGTLCARRLAAVAANELNVSAVRTPVEFAALWSRNETALPLTA